MKKLLCLSAAIVCLTSCLVGCGSKDDSKSDKSTETTTSDSAEKDTKDSDDKKESSDKSDNDDNKEQSEFIGKWECKEIEMNGEKVDNFLGVDAFALFQLDVQEEGKGTVTSALLSMFSEDITSFDIKWEKSGDDAIRIEIDESETETTTTTSDSDEDFEVETEVIILKKDGDDYIIVSEDEEKEDEGKFYLVKVDEFTPIPEDMEMSLDFSTEFGADVDGEVDFGDTDIETTTTTQKAE